MVDYSRYIVDPWKGSQEQARWAQSMAQNERQFKAGQQIQKQRMTLADRAQQQRAEAEQKRIGLAERAQARSEKLSDAEIKERRARLKEIQRKTLAHQLSFIADGLEAVDSQESLDAFNQTMDQFAQAGMLDKSIIEQGKIEDYKDVPRVRKQLKAVLGKLDKKKYGKPYVHKESGAVMQETVSGPETGKVERLAYTKDTKSKKDTRGTMSKEIDEIATTKGITRKEALKEWQMSKSYPQRIKLYNDTVRQIMEDPILDEEERAMQIEGARNDFLPEHVKEKPEFDWSSVELPEGVTKEDVEFTAEKHNMTIQEVIERLSKQ